MNRRIIIFCLLLVVLVGIGLAAFSLYSNQSVITVENETGAMLANVEVTLADKVIWTGTLAPGAVETVRGTIERPGPVGISFDANGQHHARLFSHVTADEPERGTLQVQPNFNIQYLWPDE